MEVKPLNEQYFPYLNVFGKRYPDIPENTENHIISNHYNKTFKLSLRIRNKAWRVGRVWLEEVKIR